MASLNPASCADWVQSTLYNLGIDHFEEVMSDLQGYEVASRWLKKDRVQMDSGQGIYRNVATQPTTRSRHVGSFAQDNPNVGDHLTRLEVPWVNETTDWSYDYIEDMLKNSGKARVLNVIKPRQANALISKASVLETAAWTLRGANDFTLPYGVPYWVTQSVTATSGWNGVAASGFTTKGGIDPATHTNFRNWTWQYADWTAADLMAELRRAHLEILWRSPVTVQEYRKQQDLRIYVDTTTLINLEALQEQRNDNWGNEMAPYRGGGSHLATLDGTLVFRKHPIIRVPSLDANAVAQNIVYMIDHGTFVMYVLEGNFNRRTGPIRSGDQHNVWTIHVDLTYCYVCLNVRRNACGYRV